MDVIDLLNPLSESTPEVDRLAGAATSPTPPSAAPVLSSSPEVVATNAPGMARSESESQAKATEGKAGMAVVTGHVRRSTAGTGLRVGEASADLPATSEFMGVTAGETALNSNSGRAAGSCNGIKCGEDRTQSCLRENGQASNDADVSVVTAGRDRQPFSCSGDGLGIHEPGSMTWGGDTVATAPSGKADESAKCPAVTGSNSDVIDIPAFLPAKTNNKSEFQTGEA